MKVKLLLLCYVFSMACSSAKQAGSNLLVTADAATANKYAGLEVAPEYRGVKALVAVSVANIRVQPSHKAELATQATMATPMKVWKKENGWFLVQTPDEYFGWVEQTTVQLKDSTHYASWLAADKAIFTEPFGFAYDVNDGSSTVSDLVYGDIFRVTETKEAQFIVELPDGRKASVLSSQSMLYSTWKNSRQLLPDSIINAAKKLMGVPYLWGGTSFKGVDCSGFTKTVFFMNGLVLPRDASQQADVGEDVRFFNGWKDLKPGDLLFFGSRATGNTPERVIHVGIWIGNGEFIHASGRVQVSSLDPKAPNYSIGEHRRFLRAKRIVPGAGIIDLRTNGLYQ